MDATPAQTGNGVVSVLSSHRSERCFIDEPVDDQALHQILDCARRAPNWNNGQQVTTIVVQNPGRRSRLAELCGHQEKIVQAPVFLALVMDFHRTARAAALHQREQRVQGNLNGVLIGAVDVGIVLGTMMAAARSLGLGVCPIGGIRRQPRAVCRLLDLPPLTFPMAGLCVGHVADQAHPLKPRISLESFAHGESYVSELTSGAIGPLDDAYVAYAAAMGRSDAATWSDGISRRYAVTGDYAEVTPVLREQGFGLE
ncbi:MAG: nitroreductase family protein [Burkholderiaceae bacterium]